MIAPALDHAALYRAAPDADAVRQASLATPSAASPSAPKGPPLRGHAGYVFSVAFSPDGETLASGSEDGTIHLWDTATNQAIGQPLSSDNGSVYSVTFSPNGKTLVSGSHDGSVLFWDVDWQSRVCEAVGRNLTEVEWKRYMPAGLLYHQTCPKWPAENPDTVKISVYSSKSKEDWINAVTAAFNAAQVKTASGKTVVAAVTQVNSGGSIRDILDRKIQPTVWSPGDQSWVDQANQIWGARTGRPLISEKCAPTVYDPIGFAMWRPMAEALGWPDQPIGWGNFAALAADPQGWGAYGHPEWGQFKFGHTLPDFSNSGLLIMTALAYEPRPPRPP